MNGYVVIDGVTYDLVERKALTAEEAIANVTGKVQLGTVAVGDTANVGEYEMIVLEHTEEGTVLISKDMIEEEVVFGNSNNYEGSNVDELCQEFAERLRCVAGAENMVTFDVDLTSDDGLKDYGVIQRKAALLTADQYRKYVQILDRYKPDEWWWLATPYSTATHENAVWVKCVSPAGYFNYFYYYRSIGVRPFCILKSSIFVSK